MLRISSHQLGISQGSRVLFSDFVDGGSMWTGNGPRESRFPVSFDLAFSAVPAVQVGMTMWDSDSANNQRMDLQAEAITSEGFDLVFRTWGDSRVARIRASWTAFGSLGSDEGWELY